MNHRVTLLASALLTFCSCILPTTPPPEPANTMPAGGPHNIGINIQAPYYYARDLIFADAMRSAGAWQVESAADNPPAAALDANGWPTEDAMVQVWAGQPNMHGSYQLRFEGSATVSVDWGDASIENLSTVSGISTATLVYHSAAPASIRLHFTGTSGGVRNVTLMRPIAPGSTSSYAAGTLFNQAFLQLLSRFSTIRFMDWTATNHNPTQEWSERVADSYHWASYDPSGTHPKGGSWEAAIALCNASHRNAWICVPAEASDDYVTKLAQLWRDNLDPGLALYVEYSNELWNDLFNQTSYNKDAAMAEVLAGGSPLNADGETNATYWGYRRVAKRLVEISLIFRSVWGDAAMMARVRPVLMWQLGNGNYSAATQADWLHYFSKQQGRPINYYIYGAGGSAYYSPDHENGGYDLESIWRSASFDTEQWRSMIAADAYYAVSMGLKQIAYEGGPSLDDVATDSQALRDTKVAASADPRIKDLILQHQKAWDESGGDLLCYYQSTGDHQWGFSTDVTDLGSPKLAAIDAIAGSNGAPMTISYCLPGQIPGKRINGASPSWLTVTNAGAQLAAPGESVGYLGRFPAGGNFKVRLSTDLSEASTVRFSLDGSEISTMDIPAGGYLSTPLDFQASAGLHCLSFTLVSGSFNLSTVHVGN